MIGFAGIPGTAVEPTCSARNAISPSTGLDPVGFALEEPRPLRGVVDKGNGVVVQFAIADSRLPQLLITVAREACFLHVRHDNYPFLGRR